MFAKNDVGRLDEASVFDGKEKEKGDNGSGSSNGGRPLIRVSEKDYLTEDPPIRGQNYACVSFLCPDEVLRKKETFVLTEFVKALGRDVASLFEMLDAKYGSRDDDTKQTITSLRERHACLWNEDDMKQQYEQFQSVRGDDLADAFDKSNDFATSTRGFKVRGAFETYEQADRKAKALHEFDGKRGNVFIAQVGCWCPWNPDPNRIEDNQYAIDELNTLMKKYEDNQANRDTLYETRRQHRKELMAHENEHKKDRQREQLRLGGSDGTTSPSREEAPSLSSRSDQKRGAGDGGGDKDSHDAWLTTQKKRLQAGEAGVATEDVATTSSSDPWLARQQRASRRDAATPNESLAAAVKRKTDKKQ